MTFSFNYSTLVLTLNGKDMNTQDKINELSTKVQEAHTQEAEGRQSVADACKELYNTIEEGLYNKYGQEAINDAYNDLCTGNFSEPFMCEKKKESFELYKNVFVIKVLAA